jgi:hypothetical protein
VSDVNDPDFGAAKMMAVKASKRFALYYEAVGWGWGSGIGTPTEADILLALLGHLEELRSAWLDDPRQTLYESSTSGGLGAELERQHDGDVWGLSFVFRDDQTQFQDVDGVDDEQPEAE